jgi:hypothetical protein
MVLKSVLLKEYMASNEVDNHALGIPKNEQSTGS